jgi:enoyl-CoA hydratase/carnithine racemase
MSRFNVTRDGARVDVAFDDGGVNLLSTDALRELRAIIEPGAANQHGGSFAALQPSRVPPAQDDTPRILIFRSSHAHIFAAGADIAEMRKFSPFDAAGFARLGQETFSAIEKLPMVTVAVIDGDCFGGALDLVLSFDLRFATPRSRFSHPGGKLGIVTGFGGTSRWRKVLDPAAARSLFLGNPVMSAPEARQLGLVDRVAEDFSDELLRLESVDSATVRFVKELTNHSDRLTRSQLLLVADRLRHIYFGPSDGG